MLLNKKKFEIYISQRIIRDDYRGIHLSQHNRLPFDKVSNILQVIYEKSKGQVFNIHVGDWEGREQEDCPLYYEIVNAINEKIGQSTVNSLKKNIFPDLDTMLFLDRFDKKGNKILREHKSSIKSVCLSEKGVKYAIETNPKNCYKMYVDATEILLKDILDDLFYTLYKNFDSISVYEFMFILSDENIKADEKIELIKSFRMLTGLEQIKLRNDIQNNFFEINKIAKNKTQQRDFINWHNEALQILNLLNQTIYFKTFRKTVLMLALSQEALEFIATRSAEEKVKSLEWHSIQAKKSGYELHHIYPLDYATSKKDLGLIDDYRNLIYISKSKHQQIPNKNNLFVILEKNNDKILLIDATNNNKFLDITHDIIFDMANIDEMIAYNKKLLNEISASSDTE